MIVLYVTMMQEFHDILVDIESKQSVWDFLHLDLPVHKSGFYVKSHNFKKYFSKLHAEFNQIEWKENLPFKQLLWHWLQEDIELELGKCVVCGQRSKFKNFRFGYKHTCSKSCSYISPIKKEKIKQTCLKKYGTTNNLCCARSTCKSKQTKLERYGNTHYNNLEKHKQTCQERYGVDNYAKTDTCKTKVRNTFKNRYGTISWAGSVDGKSWYANPHNVEHKTRTTRQTKLERYGDKNYNNYDKWCESHTCHKSWNKSQIEQDLVRYFSDCGIRYVYQYRDSRYPFNCDFYFPEQDLFVEIQGSWTHGFKPFNPETDLTKVQLWLEKNSKFYDNAVDTWVVRDVKKRETARNNNLNYLEIFSCDFNECQKLIKERLV